MTTQALTLDTLRDAMSQALALRSRAKLQPAGGRGDKVLPPTYTGSVYALEMRRIDGEEVPCVLIDSVQSQANRMEQALLLARDAGRLPLPLISVRFPPELVPGGRVTVLDAPHRVADAILRDATLDGVAWRDTELGKGWIQSRPPSATALYQICPVAPILGMWDSTGSLGGSGTKFPRLLVSELVAMNAREGVRTASRIDPLAIEKFEGIYRTDSGGWTLDEAQAKKDSKGKPVAAKPSELNHGNVTPDLVRGSEQGNPPIHGGITCDYIEQSVVLSLAGLRRLGFPDASGAREPARDEAARVALAALALAAAALNREAGFALRSRCDLVPEQLPWIYEVVQSDRDATPYALTPAEACELVAAAHEAAGALDVGWRVDDIDLTPYPDLVELVRRTHEGAGRLDEVA